jgi:hypothetical protein
VVNLNGSGAGAFVCALMLWALGLFIFYWVIRLAVRHALTDVGVRRLVLKSYEDDPDPDDGGAPE